MSNFNRRNDLLYLRATDGRPVCNYCKMVGHVVKYCRSRPFIHPPKAYRTNVFPRWFSTNFSRYNDAQFEEEFQHICKLIENLKCILRQVEEMMHRKRENVARQNRGQKRFEFENNEFAPNEQEDCAMPEQSIFKGDANRGSSYYQRAGTTNKFVREHNTPSGTKQFLNGVT